SKVLQVAELRMDNLRLRTAGEEVLGPEPEPPVVPSAAGVDLVTIGCSTGGPPALQHIFQPLPALPVPVVAAQHVPPPFARLCADRVNKLTQYPVREAEDGTLLEPGSVYIAPGGLQTEVRRVSDGLIARVFSSGSHDLYAPSVDRLFTSAAEAC